MGFQRMSFCAANEEVLRLYAMAQYGSPIRMKRRDVSYPFALISNGEGPEQVVFADNFSDGNRPAKGTEFICPSCKGAMHWNIGPKKQNQPDTLFTNVERGKPHFSHNPGHLNDHIVTQESSIAADLVELLYKYGQDYGYEPQLQLGNPDRAWIVSYHFTREDGSVYELPLIVSPTATQLLSDHPNAVVITATDGKSGDRRRLMLYDNKYNPLSSQQVHDFVTAHSIEKFFVSGFYERVSLRQERNGSPIFRPRQIPLKDALRHIGDGSYVFVEGVDAITYENFPTSAKFGLVQSAERAAVQHLLNMSHSRIKRRVAANTISENLGLSLVTNRSTVGTTKRYRYGQADILYVHLGMANNPRAIPLLDQRKVVVNPSPTTLLRKMTSPEWSNTMVLFVDQPNWWREFKLSDALNHLAGKTREERAQMGESAFFRTLAEEKGLIIRSVGSIKRAQACVEEFLGPEIEQAKKQRELEAARPKPDPTFNLGIFIAHETGMAYPAGAAGGGQTSVQPAVARDLGMPYQRRFGMSPLPFSRN